MVLIFEINLSCGIQTLPQYIASTTEDNEKVRAMEPRLWLKAGIEPGIAISACQRLAASFGQLGLSALNL